MAKKNYVNKALSMVDNAKIRIQGQAIQTGSEQVETRLDSEHTPEKEISTNITQETDIQEENILSEIKKQGNRVDEDIKKDTTSININIKLNSELNGFMRGERRFKELSSAEYVEYLLQKNEGLQELTSKEVTCVLRDIKESFPGKNSTFQCLIDKRINERLEETARRNRMTKTDYVAYLIYKEYLL